MRCGERWRGSPSFWALLSKKTKKGTYIFNTHTDTHTQWFQEYGVSQEKVSGATVRQEKRCRSQEHHQLWFMDSTFSCTFQHPLWMRHGERGWEGAEKRVSGYVCFFCFVVYQKKGVNIARKRPLFNSRKCGYNVVGEKHLTNTTEAVSFTWNVPLQRFLWKKNKITFLGGWVEMPSVTLSQEGKGVQKTLSSGPCQNISAVAHRSGYYLLYVSLVSP